VENGSLPENIVVLSDSALESVEVPPGQNMDNVETQLPCEPSELPNTSTALETMRKSDQYEVQVQKEVGNYQSNIILVPNSKYVH